MRLPIRKLLLGIVLILFVSPDGIKAQGFGFQGKKNTFSISGTGAFRFFPAMVEFAGTTSFETEKSRIVKYDQNNQRIERPKIGRIDLRISYMRLMSSELSLGVEFGYEKFQLPMSYYSSFDYYGTDDWVVASTPVFNAYSYIFVVEKHSTRNSAPTGFSTAFGLGPKVFVFDYDQNYRYSETEEMTNPYPIIATDIVAINFFCQFNQRTALNDFMALDVGIRLHTGIVMPHKQFVSQQNENAAYTKYDIRGDLFKENGASFISLKLGLSFML